LKTVAVSGGGVVRLRDALEDHRVWLQESGRRADRERTRLARMLQSSVEAELQARLEATLSQALRQELVERMLRREVDPHSAAAEVVKRFAE